MLSNVSGGSDQLQRPDFSATIGALLVILGLLQPLGFLLRIRPLEDVGFVSMSSPLPRVFTDRDGMEDFALRYRLGWVTMAGVSGQKQLTGSDLRRLEGPFARRAPYAAAIGYYPRLPESLWRNVLHYGFCKKSTLREAVGVPEAVARVTLDVETRTRGKAKRWKAAIRCTQ